MWSRLIDGNPLTFRLAGINNQNFLMRDEQTGTFWQQVSGRAIAGPLAGRQLILLHSEELSFSLWRQENARGQVLRPVQPDDKDYEPKDWETRITKLKTVIDTKGTGMEPRELVIGLEQSGISRAYPLRRVLEQKLIQDQLGALAILLVAGPDQKSVRAFLSQSVQPGAVTDFYRKSDTSEGLLMDSETGSTWDFRGCAISGPASGRCLTPITILKDYWFDWRLYHPQTSVYAR